MNYNQNSGYGQGLLNRLNAVAASVCPTFGRILVVMKAANPNYDTVADIVKSDPDGDVRLFTTLLAAYTAAETNRNDVILLGAYGSHHQLATMLTWAKNRIHVVGLGANGAVDMQPEIQLSAVGNALTVAATMKVTGYGNTFTNVYITNAGTGSAACLTALWENGENNVYTNCQFAKFSDLNVAGTSNVICGGDTTTWRNCKFGVDWVLAAAARFGANTTTVGGIMKHNIFEDCYFVVASSSSDYEHFNVGSTASVNFGNIFKNCVFHNSLVSSISAAAIDDSVNSIAGLVQGNLLFVNPACNSTSFCSTANQLTVMGHGLTDGGTPNASALCGVAITPD